MIDYEKEKIRLTKKLDELKARLKGLSLKLKNKKFLENAPKEIIANCKASYEEAKNQAKKLEANLKTLE